MGDNSIGHQFGNFHSYYNFHPANERTQYFSAGMFRTIWEADGMPSDFTMLDIGCNEGDLTIEITLLAARDVPSHVRVCMQGVDLDDELIGRASGKLQTILLPHNCIIEFKRCNLTDTESFNENGAVRKFLDKCGSSMGYTFISLFSVTMWVHLQIGDENFKEFMRRVCSLSTCSVLIEPQPWKCYRAAARRCRKQSLPEFPHPPNSLKLVNIDEEISKIVSEECEFEGTCWSLGTESWGRSIVVFHKENKACLDKFRTDSLVCDVADKSIGVKNESTE